MMKRDCQKRLYKYLLLLAITGLYNTGALLAQSSSNAITTTAEAKPWVFWYWMHGAVSRAGITADLESMKMVGIGGAYLMPIKDTSSAIPFTPTVRQNTPEWWAMVKFAMQEAKRLNLQLAMHYSDGFALAGGPWITPELSMQKLVWTKTFVHAADSSIIQPEQPTAVQGYYRDVAIMAYPANFSNAHKDTVLIPKVTTSLGTKAAFLYFPSTENKQSFKSDTACWIQYKYPSAFTARSVQIHVGGNNFQAQRLLVQSSNDGEHFTTVTQLDPPRHGWQDSEEDYTYSIPATTATYYRFVYNKVGSEPGAEDLDAAKWKPSLKIMGIYLSEEPVIHQYEAKNGSIWRVAANTDSNQVKEQDAVKLTSIIDVSDKLDSLGNLHWKPNSGNWVIVRIGHTSTGQTNATGGAARGLEADKFNPVAISLQFNEWFAKAFEQVGDSLANEVLKIFHLDSWECGSQNWTTNFLLQFKQRRGYDLRPYLLVMAGVPIENAAFSEKLLHDVRTTIADLVNDVLYTKLKQLAHEKGTRFSAESVAPTMMSDGLLHYKNVDLPMGEFWLNSPTHDKPNDMLDAISGAHIYGKKIIGAEAFTSVRMNWGEHPGNLKILGDRNFALGINKMVLHVFTHNPWLDKKPGMTLDGVGLYFQRDQTWFAQSREWIQYLSRCQTLLQKGNPVVDVGVFTGEALPRRSLLPNRLVTTLPGIFGEEKMASEKKRLLNVGQPLRQIPDGVSHSANMADPEDWIDPLNGYAYDSFNPDALMLMQVKKGRVVLPGGASYGVLVFPDQHPMNPNPTLMSVAVAKKIVALAKKGAVIIMGNQYTNGVGANDNDATVRKILLQLQQLPAYKKRIIPTPYTNSSFAQLGIEKDVDIISNNHSIAWTHRKNGKEDIYFISNQKGIAQTITLSCRNMQQIPQIWDAAQNDLIAPLATSIINKRMQLTLQLEPAQSLFLLYDPNEKVKTPTKLLIGSTNISTNWVVKFDSASGGPAPAQQWVELKSWTDHPDSTIVHYSGTATYSKSIYFTKPSSLQKTVLKLEGVHNIASVKVNGIFCGTVWTAPYELDISTALQQGNNVIEISVSNTWHNRLIGDEKLSPEKRVSFTTAPFRLKNKPLLPAGLTGNIYLRMYK